jgi:hypothetical protein
MASGLKYFLSDKPKVPKFERVDIGKETKTAAEENLAALPSVAAFAEKFNQLSGQQLRDQLEGMLPGYSNLSAAITKQIQSYMRGEVPSDVENLLQRRAAERGISIGGQGSEFNENQFLRNLGLTSLQLTQQGLDSASRWIAQNASMTPVYNMNQAFLPIQDRIGLKERENQFAWKRNWLKNQIAAVPWGVEGWAINLADRIESIGYQVVSSYAGMATGGGMGGGGGGGGGGDQSAPMQWGGIPSTLGQSYSQPNPGTGYAPQMPSQGFGPANYYPGSVSPYGPSQGYTPGGLNPNSGYFPG